MKADEKIIKAKARLILTQPFFATVAMHLDYIEDRSIETASTNGKVIKYNPDFVDDLSLEELTAVLAHEVMHVTLLHHTRRNNRQPKKWNVAADYAINPLLISSGFKLPESCLYDKAYENKSAEKIYTLLPDPPGGIDLPSGIGEITDAPADETTESVETEVKHILAQATIVARRQGRLPAGMERLIDKILQPCISWKEVLARFVSELARNDYTWMKPSVRYLYSNLYLPSLESEQVGNIILLVDTSISIDTTMLNQFGSEIQDIASTFNTALQVIYVDAKVQAVQHIDPTEPVKLKPKGGGGTSFRPGFDYIEKNDLQPAAVVYLTDGDCNLYPAHPDYPVLWAQFGDVEFNPPFGETIQVA